MSDEQTPVLAFELDGDPYYVANRRVANVLGDGELASTEGVRATAIGELHVAGTLVEVLDVARLFGVHADRDYEDRLVVVFHGITDGRAVGWLVDDVLGVERVDEDAVTPPPADLDHVEGRVDRDGDTVVWLDAAAINAGPAGASGTE